MEQKKTYIVAEIGGNFTTYEEACILIDAASECGVDAVKIQTYKAETICSEDAFFDMEATGKISQYDFFKKYEIDEQLHRKIYDYSRGKNIDIFSTPSHYSDVEMLEKLNTAVYKIGADDANNIPMLVKIAKLGKPMILSTGMCSMEEVRRSVDAILQCGNAQITLLHVNSAYPTYPEAVNLRAIQTLKAEFPYLKIGYSDHTIGSLACINAVALGAEMVEKHFIVEKDESYVDSLISADKHELKAMVQAIRETEEMLGNGIKMPTISELTNREKNRKSIVVTRIVKKGQILTEEDIDIKRPGMGIEPRYYECFLGKTARVDMDKNHLLDWGDVQ